jgi:MFS family permease
VTQTARASSTNPFDWRFVAPLMWGSALNPINSSIIATALVGIGSDLHVGIGSTAVLVSGLYLASAVAQPTMGKLAGWFGARTIFVVGMAVVALGGVVGGLSQNIGWLLVARVMIGIGTSAGYPTAMMLIRSRADSVGIGVPGGVLSGLTIAGAVTASLGLPLGGLLVGWVGWRSVFWINVPVAVIGIIATLVSVPADRPEPNDQTGSLWRATDPIGIAAFAGTVISLLTFLDDLRRPTWWLIAVILSFVAFLVVWERRADVPFIDTRALGRNKSLQRTYLRNLLTLLATYCSLYGFSQWLGESRHLSSTTVGVMLLPMTMIGALASGLVGRRNWIRGPLIWTGLVVIAGGLLMLLVDSSSSIVVLIGLSVVFGLTVLGQTANQSTLYQQTPAHDLAVASGLLRTSGYIGAVFSSSVIALSFGHAATDSGLHAIGYVFAGLGVLLTLVTVFDPTIPRTAD